ncbi:molybdate-anion transporter [Ipomoea triloba]|uniref:molybdate-anion transporter n=1 Tax=Ipomoea triloba TaxID=35885 RepID=UPI00125DF27F|nr:molybdate-anion transporter [Ipomoea triloba]
MAVVIDADVWEPNPALYIFLFASSLLSILCFPVNSNPRASNVLDHSLSPSLSRFRRNFIFLFSISSVMEGLWAVFGEYELTHYGVSKDQMVLSLCIGCVAALFVGSFLGILSDLIGQKKVCLLFFMLHLFVAIWKRVNANPSVWIASICLSLASSIFFFNFETWMVVEHEQQGLRQDVLNEMFWLMSLVESASFIGSQVLGNWLIAGNAESITHSLPVAAAILAIVALIFASRGWKEFPQTAEYKNYQIKFHTLFADRRIWLLSWVQACVHFSSSVFWILWAPTMVADGREILLGLLYPCFLGARMLGSTAFPWFNGPLSLRTEEYLVYIFILMGSVLSIVAFDYQEIEALLILFCIFHACVGLVLPSLARLRTMFVPNELRAGMMSLSLFPSHAAFLFFLVQRSYCHNLENSTIIAAGALGLFTAAGCMHMLKRLGKQLHQDWHKS